MVPRTAVLALALAGVPVALASGLAAGAVAQDETPLPLTTPLAFQADADPERELLRARVVRCDGERATTCPEGSLPDLQIDFVDVCGGREVATPLLARAETFVTVAETVELGGRRGREFIVAAASGATLRNGQVIVGAARAGADGCARPRTLLRLSSARPATVRPRGASYHVTGDVVAASLRRDFPGKELSVRQPWYRSDDGGCCPSFLSYGSYRYRASTDTYVRYRSRVERTRRDG